ncbi:MAG: hypothetical protein EBY32_07975 [Proteobacteria bacterium]|nr:hypothetical protein [Pseudomonadota bacterium]
MSGQKVILEQREPQEQREIKAMLAIRETPEQREPQERRAIRETPEVLVPHLLELVLLLLLMGFCRLQKLFHK